MGARGQRGSEGFQVVGFIKNHELKGPEGEYPQRDGQYMSTHNFSGSQKMLFKQSDMIINAAINEELALGVLKDHLPIKRELFFRALEFFYFIFLV